jgi:hypothetical protein
MKVLDHIKVMFKSPIESVLEEEPIMSAEEIHQAELQNQRELLQLQYRQRLKIMQLKRQGAQIVYANQQEAALSIIREFIAGKVWVVLVAPPGAGKTGVILEVLRLLGEHIDSKHQIHIKNMHVITGMSDTDWSKTMKDGMLEALHTTVHHRGELNKKLNIETLRDGILITDECHVASQLNQTIDKKLKDAGLKNIDTLIARNMRMLDVSATPEGVLSDLKNWRDHTALVVLNPDEKYKGFKTMKSESRLRSAADYNLEKPENAKELLKLFQERYKNCPQKKYFAFRVYSANARANVVTACQELGWEFEDHDSSNRVEDIDRVMETAPNKHKVFFVKGFWRASKRLVRKHVGGTYESMTSKPDDTSKSQGLTARFCNTFDWEGEQERVELRPLHFDDVESIDRYLDWWSASCDYKEAAYKAPRLRSDGEGVVKHPKTKAHPASIVGVDAIEEDPIVISRPQTPPRQRAAPTVPKINRGGYIRRHRDFTTLEDAKAHYIARFGSETGFAAKPHKCQDTGKFMCSFSNVKSAVLTVEEVRSHLATGNLWGAHQTKLEDREDPCPQIGTVKIGYNGDIPTFFLCVQSKTQFEL